MKKTLFVMAVAVVLVFAFATTAVAMGSIPNRSSAFLTTIPTYGVTSFANDVDYYNQMRALAAGGTKAAYITWGQALDAMQATNTAAPSGSATGTLLATPHSGYTATTVKCQVCHSVHKASINGTFLLAGTNGCVACHGSTTTLTTVKVAAGSSLDNRHGGLTSCASYLCHTESPHGVDVSEYAAGASVLLSDWSDFLTGAALRSGVSNGPVNGVKTNVNMDGYFFDSLTVAVYQPELDGADATAITAPVTNADFARGIAIQTGYTCANDGCHMNGSFNGVSENAYLGDWKLTLQGQSTSLYGFDPATSEIKSVNYINFQGAPDYNIANGIFGSENLRTAAIKGHELYSTFGTGTVDNPATLDVDESAAQLAWADSGSCRACHDQVDPRFGGNSFPHSNTVWRAFDSATDSMTVTHTNGVTGNSAELMSAYGWSSQFNNAAWFNIGSYLNSTDTTTTTMRNPIGSATTFTYAPRTVAMDGACLKCHRGSATTGVGFDY